MYFAYIVIAMMSYYIMLYCSRPRGEVLGVQETLHRRVQVQVPSVQQPQHVPGRHAGSRLLVFDFDCAV